MLTCTHICQKLLLTITTLTISYIVRRVKENTLLNKKRMKLRNGTMPQYFSQLFKGEYFEINTKLISLIKARDISHRS